MIYLIEVGKFLKTTYEDKTRQLMYELIIVNIVLILLDVVLLSVEYEDLYQIETTLKGAVYSVKLKLELGVLSKLVKTVTARQESYKMTGPDQELDLKRFASADVTRTMTAPVDKNNSEPSSGPRTSDESSEGHANDSNMKVTDFATVNRGGPLAGPSDEESAAAQAYLHEAHRSAADNSSLEDMYPGKLEAAITPDSEKGSWPLKT